MIERNLPENKQRRLDARAHHWDEVVRRIGSAKEFISAAEREFIASPQANDRYVIDKFADLRVHLNWLLVEAQRTAEAATAIADDNAERK